MKQMTYQEFAEFNQEMFDEYIQESYWTQDFSTDTCYEMLKEEAKKENVTLTNEDDFNYDKFFHDLYKCTEKGLS